MRWNRYVKDRCLGMWIFEGFEGVSGYFAVFCMAMWVFVEKIISASSNHLI